MIWQVLQNSLQGERTLAMNFDVLRSPVQFLQQDGISADQDWLREYEAWFEREGQGISDAVDRAGTPAHMNGARAFSESLAMVTHVRSVGGARG